MSHASFSDGLSRAVGEVTDYLLDVQHVNGRGKALFFLHFGFSIERWEGLADALIRHAHEQDVVKSERTRFGMRYVLEGPLRTPSGRHPRVRVVWFLPNNDPRPRHATAYPLEE